MLKQIMANQAQIAADIRKSIIRHKDSRGLEGITCWGTEYNTQRGLSSYTDPNHK